MVGNTNASASNQPASVALVLSSGPPVASRQHPIWKMNFPFDASHELPVNTQIAHAAIPPTARMSCTTESEIR